jgi:chloramphenicol-sensitive protein RarD
VLQYIGPSLQFLIALALGEPFTPGHAVTFGLIWLGVIVFSLSAGRAAPKPLPAAD